MERVKKTLRTTLGLRPTLFWGVAPVDFNPGASVDDGEEAEERSSGVVAGRRSKGSKRHWLARHFSGSQSHESGHKSAFYSYFHVPNARHDWGVPQYKLQASWGDLFLDLIFVGVAFQIGTLIKASFFSCEDIDASSSGNGSGSGSGAGRRLAGSEALPQCVGIEYGMLYAFALFAPLFLAWYVDVMFRSRYESSDTLHRLLDEMGYFLMAVSASNVRPVTTYLTEGFGMFTGPLALYLGLWLFRYMSTYLLTY